MRHNNHLAFFVKWLTWLTRVDGNNRRAEAQSQTLFCCQISSTRVIARTTTSFSSLSLAPPLSSLFPRAGASVYLRTSSSGTPVSTVLNISQDSKSITLTPSQPLQSATYFYFEVDVFEPTDKAILHVLTALPDARKLRPRLFLRNNAPPVKLWFAKMSSHARAFKNQQHPVRS
jgi:hypothetical protein